MRQVPWRSTTDLYTQAVTPGESRSAGSGAVLFMTGSNRNLAVAVTFEPDETLCREERAKSDTQKGTKRALLGPGWSDRNLTTLLENNAGDDGTRGVCRDRR